MASKITIPSPLRKFTDGNSFLEVSGNTVQDVLNVMFSTYPEIKKHLLDENGSLRNFVNVYVNQIDIRTKDGLNTEIDDGSDIRIIPAIAGGVEELPKLGPKEFSRYSRHFSLPEIGVKGQQKLKAGKVLIIGAGGLGCPVLLYLTAAGVGTIGIVDFDKIEESNLQRQILFGVDRLGQSKVQSAKERLNILNPHVNIIPYETPLSSENALDIIKDYDVVVDGTDNFPTRYLVNDACVFLRKPNVYGSIFRFDGQSSVFNFEDGPCYRCLYPEPPPPGLVPSCAEGGVLGVLPGIIGCIQSNETIKILTGIGKTLSGRFLLFDALEMNFSELKLSKNEDCVVCGKNPTVTELIDYQQFCGILNDEPEPAFDEISVQDLKDIFDNGKSCTLIDVREQFEVDIAKIPHAVHIPMNEIPNHMNDFNPEDEIIVHCKTGGRSAKVCEYLIDHDFKNVKNLRGGVKAWALEIDPDVHLY